uniref:Transmembrane protein n=3 Tax=Bursaphelenchus xylophilus TaxID=6326 RepID=A0A1I7SIB3_BURXY
MSSQGFWNRLTDNSDQLPVKLSFYNTLFLVLLGICICGLYALFQMLHMFLTPILWAVLVGTVLFPLKRGVSSIFGGWLNRLDEQNTPFLIGIALLPLNAFNWAADTVYNTAFSPHGYYYLGAYVSIKILSYGGTFVWILGAVGSSYSLCDEVLAFLNQRTVRMLVTVYAVTYAAWIFVQDYESLHKKKKFARTLSLPIWIVVLAYCADFCGPLRVLVFACSALSLGLISAGLIGRHIGNGGTLDDSLLANENSAETEEIVKEKEEILETEGVQVK